MHAANRSRSASAQHPGAARRVAARSTARNRSTPKSAVTPQAFHFQASNHWIPSLLLLANALHLHWWPLHQTKSLENSGLFVFKRNSSVFVPLQPGRNLRHAPFAQRHARLDGADGGFGIAA